MTDGTLRIGDLSKQSGLGVDAIRYYERQRLLPVPRRSSGGFRLFREEDVATIRFIRSAQGLGFSLHEIRELLALRSDQARACPKMQRLLRAKLDSVEVKIASLNRLRTELVHALRKCEAALSGAARLSPASCPVLDEISANPQRRRTREGRSSVLSGMSQSSARA